MRDTIVNRVGEWSRWGQCFDSEGLRVDQILTTIYPNNDARAVRMGNNKAESVNVCY